MTRTAQRSIFTQGVTLVNCYPTFSSHASIRNCDFRRREGMAARPLVSRNRGSGTESSARSSRVSIWVASFPAEPGNRRFSPRCGRGDKELRARAGHRLAEKARSVAFTAGAAERPAIQRPSAVSAATGFKSMLHNALHRRRKMRVSAVRFSVCAERFEAPNRVSAESPQRAAVFSSVVPRILAILSRLARFRVALRQSTIIVYFGNRPMADALIENLILNSPFVEPNRHFNLPTRGAPTRLSPANALIPIER
jgi:hypothetical protein